MQIYGGCFRCGRMIRSLKGKVNSLRGFKGRANLVFLSLTLTLVIDILFEKLQPQIED